MGDVPPHGHSTQRGHFALPPLPSSGKPTITRRHVPVDAGNVTRTRSSPPTHPLGRARALTASSQPMDDCGNTVTCARSRDPARVRPYAPNSTTITDTTGSGNVAGSAIDFAPLSTVSTSPVSSNIALLIGRFRPVRVTVSASRDSRWR